MKKEKNKDWKCSMCGLKNMHKLSCKTPSLREEVPIIKTNKNG